MPAPPVASQPDPVHVPDRRPQILIGLALLVWAGETAWFWHICGRNINIDAVSYIGIARHIVDGNLPASLHGYWSPLVSWLIAASSFVGQDWTLRARVLMLPEFLLCLALSYRLTLRLWSSRLLAALVVLWFTLARSTVAFSVYFIGADFLLTAAILLYFTLLLECLEHPDRRSRWLWLGVFHALAFLAKAIALPLLAFTSLLAVAWTYRQRLRQIAVPLALAALIPAAVWGAWGRALEHKYGLFMSGYQLRWNLLAPEVKQSEARNRGLSVLIDTRPVYDAYMVTDSMPPGSVLWRARVWRPSLLDVIVHREIENLPQACKELLVLLTPGGLLALGLCFMHVTRTRRHLPAHFAFVWIALGTTAVMLLAYCMLVFDTRYALPAAPLLMAASIGFAVPRVGGEPGATGTLAKIPQSGRTRAVAGVLLVLGLIAVQVYWASPFRTLRKDFELSVYAAAQGLKAGGARNVVVIGSGPYPEHGVGWEAGIYAAYFAECRIVAQLNEVPPGVNPDAVAGDVANVAPDAVLIWGTESSANYSALVAKLTATFPNAVAREIHEAGKPAGTILFLQNHK